MKHAMIIVALSVVTHLAAMDRIVHPITEVRELQQFVGHVVAFSTTFSSEGMSQKFLIKYGLIPIHTQQLYPLCRYNKPIPLRFDAEDGGIFKMKRNLFMRHITPQEAQYLYDNIETRSISLRRFDYFDELCEQLKFRAQQTENESLYSVIESIASN